MIWLAFVLSLFTTQTPVASTGTAEWELGDRSVLDVSGRITAIRYYRLQGDPGPHVGHVWGASGVRIGEVVFTQESLSGWQQMALMVPVAVPAGPLTCSVSNPVGAHYAMLPGVFAAAQVDGHITYPASAGAYGPIGSFPTGSTPTSYFRECLFVPDDPPGVITISADPLNLNGLQALLKGFVPGAYTATVSLTNASTGAVVTASSALTVPVP